MPLADHVAQLLAVPVRDLQLIGSQHLCQHYRGVLADGREIFVKDNERWPSNSLRSEARGLRWIAEPGAVPAPQVLGCDDRTLVLSWIPAASPTTAAAERFGRDLAGLHSPQAKPGAFGAPWPGFIATLPLDNTQVTGPDAWPQWYATRRLLPFLRRAADAGHLGRTEISLVESVAGRIDELAGPAEPPSRIHGDCWSGNVLWSGGQGWLIDPAAHGGHRETDLAMLALFGAPHLNRILAAYTETFPLAEGWRLRVPLHQLYPLLVHVCLFGACYASSLTTAARHAIRA
ncbi:MAG: fructosamine kinase family protein [Streptosporangiaceae bacterium]